VLQIAAQVGPDSFICVDNSACDTNSAVGTLQIANTVVDGISLAGDFQLAANPVGGDQVLNTSSLEITNTTAASIGITFAVSDVGFTGPVSSFDSSGSGVWQGPGNSTTTLGWFVDPLNTQGAGNAFDTPGIQVDAFTEVAKGITDSFAHDGSAILFLNSPFSMTEQASISLGAGESIVNRGESLVGVAVPEAPTWAMLGIGAALMGVVGMRKRKSRYGRLEFSI
jgi:hypothetical protein